MSSPDCFSYDDIADSHAAAVDTAPHNALHERPAMLALLPDVVGRRVLDAGCGSGWYAEQLRRVDTSRFGVCYRVMIGYCGPVIARPSAPDWSLIPEKEEGKSLPAAVAVRWPVGPGSVEASRAAFHSNFLSSK